MRMFLFLLSCTISPYECVAKCHCLDEAKYRLSKWEYELDKSLQENPSGGSPAVWYMAGCCHACTELIFSLEHYQSVEEEDTDF